MHQSHDNSITSGHAAFTHYRITPYACILFISERLDEITYNRDTPREPPRKPPALSSDGLASNAGIWPANDWKYGALIWVWTADWFLYLGAISLRLRQCDRGVRWCGRMCRGTVCSRGTPIDLTDLSTMTISFLSLIWKA